MCFSCSFASIFVVVIVCFGVCFETGSQSGLEFTG